MDSLRKGWVTEPFKIVKFVYFGIMELKSLSDLPLLPMKNVIISIFQSLSKQLIFLEGLPNVLSKSFSV